MEQKYRIEKDSMGEVKVPEDKYWGPQTQRSLGNFLIGDKKMPIEIVWSLAKIKKACAEVNVSLGVLKPELGEMISKVADEIIKGELDDHFPLVVYQTGSGTQTNMNVNEVISNRGNELLGEKLLHPNDHVNKSQSSNDTFPTAMHVAALDIIFDTEKGLVKEAKGLAEAFEKLEGEYGSIVKTGRTHFQDATPVTLGQEISAWKSMILNDIKMIEMVSESLKEIPLGGTAVGTGLNAPEGFDVEVAKALSKITGYELRTAENKFQGLTSKSALVATHGAVKALAADLFKIANDIRMLSSGPRCGIGELIIPENEPGSSIMPGKVNPTQCEAVTMVSAKVMGNDVTIGFAASQGQFQLNTLMPVIVSDFIESVRLLADVMRSFRINCVEGIKPNEKVIAENLEKSLMLVTALTPHIGYDKAAEIAKLAHEKGLTLREAALELGYVSEEEFNKIVDPSKMV